MHFQLKYLVLWPRSQHSPRVIKFYPGQVNVISGLSKTGKSAVIPIVDYCLCSGKCAIPVGVIRDACEWFGVVVETAEGEKLFARREPLEQKQTGDMFILEGETVEIPDRIEKKNATTDQGRSILDRLSGLSNLGMNPNSDGYAGKRTGFRDLMAFTFQPQNIVANPDVLFFKADTTEHREKLISIFPYVLNAVTQQTLQDRWELDRIQKLLRLKEAALKAVNSSVNAWVAEAKSWLQQAIELGLINANTTMPELWPDLLDSLRQVANTNYRNARPTVAAIEGVLKDLNILQKDEAEEAMRLTSFRQRLLEIKRLIESSRIYGNALYIQRDRLNVSEWLRERASDRSDVLTDIAPLGIGHLDLLCEALAGVEMQIRSRETISDKMDKEQLRLRIMAEESIGKLNEIRTQIRELERRSGEAKAEIYRADQTERYLGRLEYAITLYEKSGEDAELSGEVEKLRSEAESIRGRISEQQIQARIRRSLSEVQAIAGQIIPNLDAEWPDAAIAIIIKDLTLKILHDGRDDYLWEIGSGANWLAYHVAVSLAFQRFFQSTPAHPVPSFLVYDQPSQVYFPQTPRTSEIDDTQWDDEDIIAVRKVFTAVSQETLNAKGRLQVILLDHADQKIWQGIPNTVLVQEWRSGDKLVPTHWISTP